MDWLLHQLSDSAFPTGGFVHSGGLEAAHQQGEVDDLGAFAEDWLWQAGSGALPLVRAAHQAPGRLPEWDARAHAFLAGHVANRASRTQGRAFLDTCARIFPAVVPLRDRTRGLKLHYAPVFGATVGALGISLEDAQRLFLSLGLRGLLSAAVRLGIAGTHEAQRLQAALAPVLEAVHARCGALGPEALAQSSPLLELWSATHDRLYSRLFQS